MRIAIVVPDEPFLIPLTLVPVLHHHADITSGIYVMRERDMAKQEFAPWLQNIHSWGMLGYSHYVCQTLCARWKSWIHRHSVFYHPASPRDIADYFDIPVQRIPLDESEVFTHALNAAHVQWVIHLAVSWADSTAFPMQLTQPILHLTCGTYSSGTQFQYLSKDVIQKSNCIEVSVVQTGEGNDPVIAATESITIEPEETWWKLEMRCRIAGGVLLARTISMLETE